MRKTVNTARSDQQQQQQQQQLQFQPAKCVDPSKVMPHTSIEVKIVEKNIAEPKGPMGMVLMLLLLARISVGDCLCVQKLPK